ncbi:MAG TPA: glycosyltransferase family 4 protein [Candidatus Limnocylindrales bacterium]|jgi:glycosyltransferase involved in cell wall biosynthesis
MPTTAFVSTYPPQRCGIATFTSDLSAAVGDREVVALQPPDKPGFYPLEVSRRIARDVLPDYLSAAHWINERPFRVVSLQHEYGIWGGQDGAYVLDFVKALRTPVVATLHTVLQNPTPSQRRILTELVHLAAETVVMSTAAASLMTRSYGIDPTRLEIVPHGVPKFPLMAPDGVKSQLGLAGHKVILSFGLLGPGKGYESAIAAMPAVVRADPTAVYVIVGATHPELLRREGEAYREQLMRLAASLGVADRVRFVGRYVAAGELALWLTAADIFVTPYPNLEQIVSGTLSYAMGAGKAIVSTPYAYASEQLAQGRGRLVAAGSTDALADGLIELALSSALRSDYSRKAGEYSRGMQWPEIGTAYGKIFDRVAGVQHRREDMAGIADRVAIASA